MTYFGTASVSGVSYLVYHCWVSSVSGPYFAATSNNIGTTAQNCLSGSASLLNSSITPAAGLSVDSVSDSLSGSAYAQWTAGAITQEDQPFVPVSIPSVSDSAAIFGQTQAQAQAGTIPDAVVDEVIAGAEVDPDVVTLSDIFTAIRSLGSDVVEAIQAVPTAIAAFFEPPVIYDGNGNVIPAYQISLTDFFRFVFLMMFMIFFRLLLRILLLLSLNGRSLCPVGVYLTILKLTFLNGTA